MSTRNYVCSSTGFGLVTAGERHALFWGRETRRNQTVPGVIMVHGHQNPAESWYLDARDDLSMEVAASGLIGLAQQSGSTFGNDAGIALVADAYTWLRSAGGGGAKATGPVQLLGFSHGASNLLAWARTNVSSVSGIALICPAVDIEDIRVNNRSGFQAVIEAAWGTNAAWQAARPTRNPVEYASQLASIPISIWYGGADTITVPSTMTAFSAAHGNTTLTNMGAAVAHDVTALPDGAVLNFLATHAA